MTVSLKDIDDQTLWSIPIEPKRRERAGLPKAI